MCSYRNNVFNNDSDAVIFEEISAFVLCCHNFDCTSLVRYKMIRNKSSSNYFTARLIRQITVFLRNLNGI